MIATLLALGLVSLGAEASRGDRAPSSAADRITLRDGSTVLGVVNATTPGPRGSVEFLVRRDWAEKALQAHAKQWDRASAPSLRLAATQRRKRLEAWRRDRAAHADAGDRTLQWIDQELARTAGGAAPKSVLMSVRLPRSEVRELDRRPAGTERLLRLAWLCKLPDPESMPLGELKDSLESRGYALDAGGRSQPVALDALLPPVPEPEQVWLARRAATELSVDQDLRFIRFQDTVLPDAGTGGLPGGVGLSTAMSELKRLLEVDQGQQADPLLQKLNAVAQRGRAGAVVTRLQIAPDMSNVTVESTLWIRSGDRWTPFGSRTATVRPEELGDQAGKGLETDPQIQGAFKIVESLGLGAIPADLKERSLRIGAATEKALALARSAFNEDLQGLALPVLEPGKDAPTPKADQRAATLIVLLEPIGFGPSKRLIFNLGVLQPVQIVENVGTQITVRVEMSVRSAARSFDARRLRTRAEPAGMRPAPA